MHVTANSTPDASTKLTPDNSNRPSRTLVPGQFFCLNAEMRRWRLVLSRAGSAVYDLLAWHADSRTHQWTISEPDMAEELDRSERFVRQGVSELKSFHLIDVQRHQRSKSTYRLLEVPPVPAPKPLDRQKVFRPEENLDRQKVFRSREAHSVPIKEEQSVPHRARVTVLDHNHLPEPKAPYEGPPARSANDDRRNVAKQELTPFGHTKPSPGEITTFWADVAPMRMHFFGQSEEEVLAAFPQFRGTKPTAKEVQPCS